MASAAKKTTEETKDSGSKDIRPATTEKPMKYAVIRLGAPRSEHEIVRPSVNVNGKIYQLPRQVPLPVPHSVVEVLNHTEHPVYKSEHGNSRAVAHMTVRYPFETIYREISPEVYRILSEMAKQRHLTIEEVDEVVRSVK